MGVHAYSAAKFFKRLIANALRFMVSRKGYKNSVKAASFRL